MSATDELRRLLNERGVEYETDDRNGLRETIWCGTAAFQLSPTAKMTMIVTPEQAIAATLRADECAKCAEDMGAYADSLCDSIKEWLDELLRCLENDWNISASWDGLRKFWNIELTEEGIRLRDATYGTLTAEQVREAWTGNLKRDCLYDPPTPDWQAIADELNATLGSGECEFVIEDNMNETEGMGDVWFRCTNCNTKFDYYADDWIMKQNYCPHCGFKIRKAVKR